MVMCKKWFSVMVIFGAITAFAQSKQTLAASGANLTVQLTSDRSLYKIGEPIFITIILRNEGNRVVWVSKPRGVGRFPGEFYVEVIAPDGTLLPNNSPVLGDSLSPTHSIGKAFEDFLCSRVPMFPGEFWGVTRSTKEAFVASPRTPGRYKITAKYLDEPVHAVSKAALHDIESEARFPIRTEPVASESLVIEIN